MPYEALSTFWNLPLFALIAGRIAGVVMFLPILGGFSIPGNVRALFVLGLAVLITPIVPPPAQMPDTPARLAFALTGELAIGVVIGLAVRGVFLALELAGSLIATESGMSLGEIADPNSGVEQNVLSMLYVQLGLAIFLAVGAHRELVAATLDSFVSIPLLSGAPHSAAALDLAITALQAAGELAVRIAAPTLLTLFLANVALGFIGRTTPHLNIATVGFSVKGMLAFLTVAASMPAAMEAYVDVTADVVGWVRSWMSTN